MWMQGLTAQLSFPFQTMLVQNVFNPRTFQFWACNQVCLNSLKQGFTQHDSWNVNAACPHVFSPAAAVPEQAVLSLHVKHLHGKKAGTCKVLPHTMSSSTHRYLGCLSWLSVLSCLKSWGSAYVLLSILSLKQTNNKKPSTIGTARIKAMALPELSAIGLQPTNSNWG